MPRKKSRKKSQRGGLPIIPALTAAYAAAKAIKPATRISDLVGVIPGAQAKLQGNAVGRVFLKGLDIGKTLGFGQKQKRRKAMPRRGRGMIVA